MQRKGSASTLASTSSNQFTGLSLQPTTSSTAAHRRLNRKQAPALTESLLNLSLVPATSASGENRITSSDTPDRTLVADELGVLVRAASRGSDKTIATAHSNGNRPRSVAGQMYSTVSSRKQLDQAEPVTSKAEDKSSKSFRKRNQSLTDRFFDNPFKRSTSSAVQAQRSRKISEPFNFMHGSAEPLAETFQQVATITPSSSGELTMADTQTSSEQIPTPPRHRAVSGAPTIPSRGASLPVDPASEEGKLRHPAKQPANHPYQHFLYPDSPLVERDDMEGGSPQALRPSARTFMTGYSLIARSGGELVSDEEDASATRGVSSGPGEPTTVKSNSHPLLIRSPSSPASSFREQMPFGRARSRKDPSSEIRIKRKSLWESKSEQKDQAPAIPERRISVSLHTPATERQRTSSSVSRMASPRLGVDGRIPPHKYSGSCHTPSVISAQSPRLGSVMDSPLPNTWAELEAIEAEEARMQIQRTAKQQSKPVTATNTSQPALRPANKPKMSNRDLTDSSQMKLKSSKPRETWSERKARKKREDAILEAGPDRLPTPEEMLAASELEIRDLNGKKVKFGSLLDGSGAGDVQIGKTTIVVFIRHWYCPLCGDYVDNIVRTVPKSTLDQANIDLIIIGNGSYKMIPGYSKHFEVPFRMYTDSKLRLYRALGMTRQTGNGGPDDEKGEYIQLTGMGTVKEIAKRATKMPLRNPGSINQIGGEFIFRSPLTPVYAHRMLTTRDHSPIRDIILKAGALLEFHHFERGPPPPDFHRSITDVVPEGEEEEVISEAQRYALQEKRRSEGMEWINEREEEIARIKKKREERQSGSPNMGSGRFACEPEIMSDSEAEVGPTTGKTADRKLVGMGIVIEGPSRFKEMLDSPTRSQVMEE